MASDGMSNVGNEEEPNDNDKYNPKLDFFSEEFDPLLALKTPNLVVPVSNATTHDNLQKFKSVVEGKRQENTSKVAEISTEVSIERRWVPHQCKCYSGTCIKPICDPHSKKLGYVRCVIVKNAIRMRILKSTMYMHCRVSFTNNSYSPSRGRNELLRLSYPRQ